MSNSNSTKDTLVAGSDARPPILYQGNYLQWSSQFTNYIMRYKEQRLLINFVKNGPYMFREINDPENVDQKKMHKEEDLSVDELDADMGKEVIVGDPKCFKCGKQGQYSRNCLTRNIRNKTYFIERMLLVAKEQGQALTADEHDFLVYTDDKCEQLETNVVFMARLEKMKAFETEHDDFAEAS
ncbi:F-box domain containing protein [Tanacetum coccineum]|uniref:F-box domain containing protein n=1 Tax=Tanacetum coccineum TaxID=301880 RepID=A0ABQ5EPH3_9ASTR